MHAALATGLDRHGLAAATDPVMFSECSRYIEVGDYLVWPYRGADSVETAFTVSGIAATRQTVYMLRSSPEVAQRGFDARLTRS
jgi:hypothetical protein